MQIKSSEVEKLPKYCAHKVVHAGKILDIVYEFENLTDVDEWDGTAKLFLEGGVVIDADAEYVRRHLSEPGGVLPKSDVVGGYFVVYQDGYESFSPLRAFEEGYSRVPNS